MERICTIITKDKKQYKLELVLLKRYSTLIQVMIDDEVMDSLELDHVSSSAFDYVYEFFQLHKVNPPKQVTKPVVRNMKLNTIMSEQDVELMERISGLQSKLKVEIMNSAMYLQMQSFKKLLTYTLMKKQLQEQIQVIKTSEQYENQIKDEIKNKINSLIELENHRKRLEQENFQTDINFQ